MPINNFANLVADIKRRAVRDDIADADVESYIQQAEAEMYHNARESLRTRDMEARATASLSTTVRFLELPADFIEMRRLKINQPFSGGPDYDVEYLSPEMMPLQNDTRIPVFFTVTTQLEFDSVSDSAYTIEMQYIKKVTALSSSNTTNAILTNYPNIYIYGALWSLFMDKREYDIANQYYTLFIGAIHGANMSTRDGKYGPVPYIRDEGYLP